VRPATNDRRQIFSRAREERRISWQIFIYYSFVVDGGRGGEEEVDMRISKYKEFIELALQCVETKNIFADGNKCPQSKINV